MKATKQIAGTFLSGSRQLLQAGPETALGQFIEKGKTAWRKLTSQRGLGRLRDRQVNNPYN